MEIHLLVAGEQIGPLSESQVRQYLGKGLVASSDLATCQGMTDWQSLDHFLSQLPPENQTISPDAPPASPNPAESTPPPPFIMQKDTSPSVDLAPSPPPTSALPPLTATQKTKRKLSKIVIQPILPLEATVPVRKKPATGKTALTMEPLRPTTALPPVTGPSPREKKGKRIKTGHLSLGMSPEKPTAAASPASTFVPAPRSTSPPSGISSTPPAVSNGARTAAPPPIPAGPKTVLASPLTKAARRPLPRRVIYACAGLGLILLVLLLSYLYLTFAHSNNSPAANPAQQDNVPAPPSQAEMQGTGAAPVTAADYNARGLARQSKGDLDGAISDYTQALSLDSKNVEAYYRRGLAQEAKSRWNEAISDYNAVLGLDPKNADAFSNRGFVKQAKGDGDGALADYTQALLINPKIPVAYYNEGLIKVQKGDLNGAILAYNHALDLDPKMAIAYYNRGNAKNTEGNLDGAIADYTQALVLNPKIALAFCNRGFARQSKGDPNGALADYAQALVLNPKMVVAYYNRGLIKLEKGDLDGAIADSSHAIDLDPRNGQAYCNRGLARMGKSNLDGATSDLKKFCELAPRDSGADAARLYLWLISTEQNPKGHADPELTTALQNDWNSPPEDLTSKTAAFLLGHVSESEFISDAASPDPAREPGQYCKVWYFAGMKRLLGGDSTTAVDYFEKSAATQQKDLCEYFFAQSELRTLGQSLPIPSPGN